MLAVISGVSWSAATRISVLHFFSAFLHTFVLVGQESAISLTQRGTARLLVGDDSVGGLVGGSAAPAPAEPSLACGAVCACSHDSPGICVDGTGHFGRVRSMCESPVPHVSIPDLFAARALL